MKSRTSPRTLGLMARVARVREIQFKQALVVAITQKNVQDGRALHAEACVARADEALQNAWSGPVVDLARLPHLQLLSTHVEATLAGERERLMECQQQVKEQADVVAKGSRYRERLEGEAAAVTDILRLAYETRELELATEAWLIFRHAEVV